MPNLRDNMPETPSLSELNPLTNPLLERNLGRWAKVYFSNPPAKREQAVNDLLEEIKRESGIATAATDRSYFSRTVNFAGMACSACQRQNPPGHRFCSRCGEALIPPPTGAPQAAPPQNAPAAQAPPSRGPANNVVWLRDQAFNGMDGSEVPSRRGWKYAFVAAAIVLAGYAYLQWMPKSKTAGESHTASPQVTAAEASIPPENAATVETKRPAQTIPPESTTVIQNPAPPRATADRAEVSHGIQSAAQKSPLPDATDSRQTGAIQESGAADLRLAQRYLAGSMGARDSTEAAKLLWKAVAKQNAAAAVLLSDLYLRGDGVPRSCDQARLLLIAAARRGAPEAVQPLQQLESYGCR